MISKFFNIVSNNKKQLILNSMVAIAESGVKLDQIFDILIEENRNDAPTKALLVEVKKEYLSVDMQLPAILLKHKFISAKDFMVFETHSNVLSAIKEVANMDKARNSIMRDVFSEGSTPLLFMSAVFIAIGYFLPAIRETTDSILKSLEGLEEGLVISYPTLFANQLVGLGIGAAIVGTLFLIVVLYLYGINKRIDLVYKIIPAKAYEDMPAVLKILQLLNESKINDREIAMRMAQRVEPVGLRRYFYEVSQSNDVIYISSMLTKANVPSDIITLMSAYEHSGSLFEKNREIKGSIDKISQVEWLANYCDNKSEMLREILLKTSFGGLGIKGLSILCVIAIGTYFIYDSLEMFEQIKVAISSIKNKMNF